MPIGHLAFFKHKPINTVCIVCNFCLLIYCKNSNRLVILSGNRKSSLVFYWRVYLRTQKGSLSEYFDGRTEEEEVGGTL